MKRYLLNSLSHSPPNDDIFLNKTKPILVDSRRAAQKAILFPSFYTRIVENIPYLVISRYTFTTGAHCSRTFVMFAIAFEPLLSPLPPLLRVSFPFSTE